MLDGGPLVGHVNFSGSMGLLPVSGSASVFNKKPEWTGVTVKPAPQPGGLNAHLV